MTVSAIIPQLDRADLLASALRSLAVQRLPGGAEIETIVADNGSRDASVAVARAHGARALLLGRNRGVGYALNRGIEAARGEWVALLNNDVELAPDWLATLLEGASRSGAWFATGKVLDAARRDRVDGAGDALCRGAAAWRVGHGRADGPHFSAPRPTFFPSATAALFRREFFVRAGLFDESFFAYLEDVDLGVRAAARGLPGAFVPKALAWHLGSATAGRWSAGSVSWITRHQLLLVSKHYSEAMLLRFALPLAVAQLLWAALALSRGRGAAWLDGIRRGVADFRANWRPGPRPGERDLVAALLASEREIAALQEATGWDTFWKWYFRLTRPDREARA